MTIAAVVAVDTLDTEDLALTGTREHAAAPVSPSSKKSPRIKKRTKDRTKDRTVPPDLSTIAAHDDAAPAHDDAALSVIWDHRANLRQPIIPAASAFEQLGMWTNPPVGSTLPAMTIRTVVSGSSSLPYGRDRDVLDGILTYAHEGYYGRARGQATIVNRGVFEDGHFEATLLVWAGAFLDTIGRQNGKGERDEVERSLERIGGAWVRREAADKVNYLDDHLIYQKGTLLSPWSAAVAEHPGAELRRHGNQHDPIVFIVRPSETMWRWAINEDDALRNIDGATYRCLSHGRGLFKWLLGQLQAQPVRRNRSVEVRLDYLDQRLGLGYRARKQPPRNLRRSIALMLDDIKQGAPGFLAATPTIGNDRGWQSKVRIPINTASDLLPHRQAADDATAASAAELTPSETSVIGWIEARHRLTDPQKNLLRAIQARHGGWSWMVDRVIEAPEGTKNYVTFLAEQDQNWKAPRRPMTPISLVEDRSPPALTPEQLERNAQRMQELRERFESMHGSGA